MKRNIAIFGFKTRSKLFGIVDIHRISEAVMCFSDFFASIPPIGLILGFPSTKRGDSRTLACLMERAKVTFLVWRPLAGRLTLTTRGRWRHLLGLQISIAFSIPKEEFWQVLLGRLEV